MWSQIKSLGQFGLALELCLQVLKVAVPMEEQICMKTREPKVIASRFGSGSIKEKVAASSFWKSQFQRKSPSFWMRLKMGKYSF